MFSTFLSDPISFIFGLLNPINYSGWFSDGSIFSYTRATFIVINWILIALFIFSFVKAVKYRPKLHPKARLKKATFTLADEMLVKRWSGVRERATAGSEDSLRLAIIDADKLADDVLKKMGLQGEHMADRLAQLSENKVHTLERLWRAHRIRNDLVHSPGFSISTADAKRALDDYEAFLREVKALQ